MCSSDLKAPPYLALEVVVDGKGHVSDLQFQNWTFEPARTCMLQALQKQAFPRNGTDDVRVAVKLQR